MHGVRILNSCLNLTALWRSLKIQIPSSLYAACVLVWKELFWTVQCSLIYSCHSGSIFYPFTHARDGNTRDVRCVRAHLLHMQMLFILLAGVLNSLVPGSSTALDDSLTTGREGYVQPGIFLYYDFLLKKLRSLPQQMLKKCTCFLLVHNKINKSKKIFAKV